MKNKSLLLTFLLILSMLSTAWADDIASLQQNGNEYYVNMASSGTTILTLDDANITTFKVYDDGGKNNNYAYANNSTLKITVPGGCMLKITGTAVSPDTYYDYWNIYNGHVYADGTLFGGQNKSYSSSIDVATTGNKAAIWFHRGKSAPTGTRYLELTVTIIDVAKDIAHASVTGLAESYTYTGSAISLEYTVTAYGGSTPLTKGTDYTETITKGGETVTSAIEEGNYTLTITGINPYKGSQSFDFDVWNEVGTLSIDNSFSEGEAGYYYINMPGVGMHTKTLDLSNKSDGFAFNIYDDGGKGEWGTGPYWDETSTLATKGSFGYIKITAPAGFVIQLTGKVMTTNDKAYLTVYNGDNTNCQTLLANVHGANGGRADAIVDIGTLVSTGNTMLVYFQNNSSWESEGLWLTATLVNNNTIQNITYADYSNGTVTSYVNSVAVTAAVPNTEVTLSVAPDDGYIINYITVTDGNNNIIPVTGGRWYSSSTSATFTMPASAVTVTPVFIATSNMTASNGLRYDASSNVNSISMGSNVHSYNIYADTQIDLTVSADEGNKLKFDGSVGAPTVVGLGIYDGSNSSATTLFGQKAAKENVSAKSSGTSMYFISNGSTSHWFFGMIAQIYAISYDLTDGTLADANPIEYTCESDAFTLNNPTREGYEFAGWVGTGLDAASTNVTIAKGNYGNREYTATWTPITYTVSFDANGGTGDAMTVMNLTYDEVKNLTANTYTPPSGYVFAGWNTQADGDGTDYADQAEVSNLVTTQGANIDLFAQWKKLFENSNITVSDIADQTYTGSAMCPDVVVKDGETPLEADVDYTVECTDNISAGTAKMTISGMGNYAGSISKTFEILKAPLTVTGVSVENKVYDGSTSATITGTAAVLGVLGSDDVGVEYGTAVFAEANVGEGIAVAFSGFTLTGADKNNYYLSDQPASVTANITKAPLTVTGVNAENKVYDGSTSATITGTTTVSGVLDSDDVGVEYGTAVFAKANVGEGIAVAFSGFTLTGADKNNYYLSDQPASVTANITKAPLTVTAKNDTITYGDDLSFAGVVYSGFVGEEDVSVLNGSLAYECKYDRGGTAGKYDVTPGGLTAENYDIEFVAGELTVEPKVVSIAWGEQTMFVYNGSEQIPTATAEGLLEGDDCELTVTGAAKNAGNYTATVTGLSNPNYKMRASGSKQNFEILKADPTIIKAPVAVENLVYSGKAQTLVVAGEAQNGVMVYKLEGADSYTEALPSATEAGDYTVYFMVQGDENYKDSKVQELTVTIAEAPESSSSAEESSSSVEIASSSSEIPVSSSSENASSSSSSSETPKSSSSSEKVESSSSETTTPLEIARNPGALKVAFAHNELTVTAPTASEVKVYIFDLQGNLKQQYRGHAAGTHSVSLAPMNRGLYLVKVVSGGSVQTLRAQVK